MRIPAPNAYFTALLVGALTLFVVPSFADEGTVIDQGREVAFDRKKGNCLACHQMEGGDLPGNIGPPLVAMKYRFPERAKLRAQIFETVRFWKEYVPGFEEAL